MLSLNMTLFFILGSPLNPYSSVYCVYIKISKKYGRSTNIYVYIKCFSNFKLSLNMTIVFIFGSPLTVFRGLPRDFGVDLTFLLI